MFLATNNDLSLSNHIETPVLQSFHGALQNADDVLMSEHATSTEHPGDFFSQPTNNSMTPDNFFASNYQPAALSNLEWEAGVLLELRQKFFLPFEALLLVSTAIHNFYNQRVLIVQVFSFK